MDEAGSILAKKNGVALITVTVDGVKKICTVVVKQPTIELNKYEIHLNVGEHYQLQTKTDTINPLTYQSSNELKVSVSSSGLIQALTKGTAYIYVSEDGTKVKCKVIVTEE